MSMEELRKLTKDERARAYNEVFREAFPDAELKPLAGIEHAIAKGEYDFFGLFVDGGPVAYVCNWLDGRYILIDYLCVPKALRCGGWGSRALLKMMEQYPEDTVFIGETEAVTGDPARDGLILRRQNLYLRLGAQYMPFECGVFCVRYRTLVWSKHPVEPEEVLRRYDGFYRRGLPEAIYRAAIQIPLGRDEALLPEQDWEALGSDI